MKYFRNIFQSLRSSYSPRVFNQTYNSFPKSHGNNVVFRNIFTNQYSKFIKGAVLTSLLFTMTVVAQENQSNEETQESSSSSSTTTPAEANSDEVLPFIVPNRTEEPSPLDTTTTVKRIVGSTAENILLDPSKTVFLKIYSPSCDSCRKLDCIWQVVADEFSKVSDDIIFANMDGYKNYIRGLVDVHNEGHYPHLISFPNGVETMNTFRQANKMSNEFAQYHNHRIPEELKKTLVFDANTSDKHTDIKPSFTRLDIPIVGNPWNLKWRQGQTMLDGLFEYIENSIKAGTNTSTTSITSEQIDHIKDKVYARIPEIQQKILEQSNDTFLTPWDKAVMEDPCGQYIHKAMNHFYTASAGLPTAPLGAIAMGDYRQCLYKNEKHVRKFYKEIEEHVDFLTSLLQKDKEKWIEQDRESIEYIKQKYPLVYQQHLEQLKEVDAQYKLLHEKK